MQSLIDQLYNPQEIPLIKSLYKEEPNREPIFKAIGHKLLLSENITLNQPLNQLCLITCLAPFADSDSECVGVAVAVFSLIKVSDVLPSLQNHRYVAFSNRTLVSLSFFPEAMQKRYERRSKSQILSGDSEIVL